MYRILSIAILSLLGTVLSAQNAVIKKYEVLPGNYFKHYGTSLDLDLKLDEDQKIIGRKGLLTDGSLDYAPKTGICYVFWRAKPEDSFISFNLELEKETEIGNVEIYGSNLSPIYKVVKAAVETSEDEISFDKAGEVAADDKINAQRPWKLTIPCNKKAKFLKITVWGGENNYLNVTEIKLTGK
jgi:hypothetical protein